MRSICLLLLLITSISVLADDSGTITALDKLSLIQKIYQYPKDQITVLGYLKGSSFVVGNHGGSVGCCGSGECPSCPERVDGTYRGMLKQYLKFYLNDFTQLERNENLKMIIRYYSNFHPVDDKGLPLGQKFTALADFITDIVAKTPSRQQEELFFKSALAIATDAFSSNESYTDQQWFERQNKAKSEIREIWKEIKPSLLSGELSYRYVDSLGIAAFRTEFKNLFYAFLLSKDQNTPSFAEGYPNYLFTTKSTRFKSKLAGLQYEVSSGIRYIEHLRDHIERQGEKASDEVKKTYEVRTKEIKRDVQLYFQMLTNEIKQWREKPSLSPAETDFFQELQRTLTAAKSEYQTFEPEVVSFDSEASANPACTKSLNQ